MARHLRRYPAPLFWFLVVCIIVLAAAIVLVSIWANHLQQKLIAVRSEVYTLQAQLAEMETTPTEPVIPQTEPPTEPEPTTPPTEAPTTPTVEDQPVELTALLELDGITYDMLAEKQCSQLITVETSGNKSNIRMFTCEEGLWQMLPDLDCAGFIGRNGSTDSKQEGDGCTPTGLYGVGSAFYTKDAPETGLDLFQITRDTYWIDDPNSQFYNQRVEGTENKDWKSAEHMIDYPEYLYGFVVDYNLAAEKGAGSAIFFHINDNPTAGCIATSEEMVLAYLAQLDKQQHPHILIVTP